MKLNNQFIARVRNVTLKYKEVVALDGVTIDFPKGKISCLIGPDGVGKSSLLALVSGAREIQEGDVEVFSKSLKSKKFRRKICPQISYMPQGLGKNLYPTLSVYENVDFFARLFNINKSDRKLKIEELLRATGLLQFASRPAGKLSGGMKQKLGLCCALIHRPELLILDEPTTGVDPLSRKQFWLLIEKIRASVPGLSILVATAYMEEAASFDHLIMMNRGKILATGSHEEILSHTGEENLEKAFISMLPEEQKRHHREVIIDSALLKEDRGIVIETKNLTKKFGDFVAVNDVTIKVKRGEIFGFLGSNGCGKTTTMKMLTGLLPASEGEAFIFGEKVVGKSEKLGLKVGYMTQSFSLYSEISLKENLILHARLFFIKEELIEKRVQELSSRFNLDSYLDKMPNDLPLGVKQRLSLAVALIHGPEILILDEPTSGVDPVARDNFWNLMLELAHKDNVTIFISTHFMNEAERCDRIAFMHAGKILDLGKPDQLVKDHNTSNLEETFIKVLSSAGATSEIGKDSVEIFQEENLFDNNQSKFSFQRLLSYSYREGIEVVREPIRLLLALLGSVVLLVVMCFGISMDVENLPVAIFDEDQSVLSRDYADSLSASRYFDVHKPVRSMDELTRRMKSGELSLVVGIPPLFEANIAKGTSSEVGMWLDGSMPTRAETVLGYARGVHQHWLTDKAKYSPYGSYLKSPLDIEVRYRYNPEVKSLLAIVPAIIPILLIFIPAMLAALAVVREKELGSIVNLYVTPVTRLEFILGKQLPYVALSVINFIILVLIAVFAFGIPLKGGFLGFVVAATVYLFASTGFGLLLSSFTNSQMGALFGTAILSMIPAVQFSGLLQPISSLDFAGQLIGKIFPTSYFLIISTGVFMKSLKFYDYYSLVIPMGVTSLAFTLISIVSMREQEK